MKYKITKIGTIDENGVLKNWLFDAVGSSASKTPAMEFCKDGTVLYGGWTIEELRELLFYERYFGVKI